MKLSHRRLCLQLASGLCLIALSACTPRQYGSADDDGSVSPSRIQPISASVTGKKGKTDQKNTDVVGIPSMGGHLKIATAVESALRNNIETKIFKARGKEAAAGINAERGQFDVDLSGEGTTGVNEFSNGGTSLQANKRFITGTSVRVETGTRFNENLDIGDELGQSRSSDLGVRLRQPLLRGAGSKYNKSGIDRARLVAVASDVKTQAQIFETLRQVESAYWSASTYQELVLLRMNSLSRTTSIVEDVQARLQLGTATKIDLLEAEASQARARAQLVQARKLYRDEIDRIQVLLGMDLETGHMVWELDEVTREFDRRRGPSVKKVYANAIENAPEIALLINAVEQRTIEAFRARKDKLPRLDIEMDGLQRREGGNVDPWEAVGLLRVSMPLGNRQRRAAFEQAQARLEQSQLSKSDGELKLKQRIFEVTRQIETGREELKVAEQSLKVNLAKWNEQLARSKEGLVSTRRLRESEEELRGAEVTEITARLRLILAWSLLSQLDGSISQRLGVELHSKQES